MPGFILGFSSDYTSLRAAKPKMTKGISRENAAVLGVAQTKQISFQHLGLRVFGRQLTDPGAGGAVQQSGGGWERFPAVQKLLPHGNAEGSGWIMFAQRPFEKRGFQGFTQNLRGKKRKYPIVPGTRQNGRSR